MVVILHRIATGLTIYEPTSACSLVCKRVLARFLVVFGLLYRVLIPEPAVYLVASRQFSPRQNCGATQAVKKGECHEDRQKQPVISRCCAEPATVEAKPCRLCGRGAFHPAAPVVDILRRTAGGDACLRAVDRLQWTVLLA